MKRIYCLIGDILIISIVTVITYLIVQNGSECAALTARITLAVVVIGEVADVIHGYRR
jgi:hypothetical protein